MRRLRLLLPLLAALAAPPGPALAEENVNSRYTVEKIDIQPEPKSRLSDSLREEIARLVGEKFNQNALDRLAKGIRRELQARAVEMKVSRGTKPEHVIVVFSLAARKDGVDVVLPRFVYHSRQNFTFGVDLTWRHGGHALRLGALTDNNELLERYSGIRGGYERSRLAGDRLSLRFDLASYRTQWNTATQVALQEAPGVPGVYRTRASFEPAATVLLSRSLSVSVGAGFQRFQTQFPAARDEGAHAAVTTLRYRQEWEQSPVRKHEFQAGYSLRAATRSLDSDYVYTRHFWDAEYQLKGNRELLRAQFRAGFIYGQAPLFERFALGNSYTLRGWNKIDVDPLGGDRMAHGSLEYRFRFLGAMYDVGSTWRRSQGADVRHSVAVGVGSIGEHGVFLLVAFPIRERGVEPIFMTGLNF